MQPSTGIKGFATRPIGRAVLIAVAIVTLGVGVIYLGELLGVAVLLLFGLAVPIYTGWKRPRSLALAGIVILLLAAPLAAILATEQSFQPNSAISSAGGIGEVNGSFLQNAYVAPFSATTGHTFQFFLTVDPAHLNASWKLVNLTLFVSTCPDATIADQATPTCTTPYPSYTDVRWFNGTPANTTTVDFSQHLPAPNLFWWIAYATCNYTVRATPTSNATVDWGYIWLAATGGYVDSQGPVVGDFVSILGIIIFPVYELVLFYPGIVFYVALLLYAWYKSREARRQQGGWNPAPPPSSSPPSGPSRPPGGPEAAGTDPPAEQHCPKCGAVVYATESQCWKCGTSLTAAADAPLPSPRGPG